MSRFPDVAAFLALGGPVRVIAHRGFSAEAPENTILAFEGAVAVDADMIECDVQLTADREVVVIHDEALERTTSGRGPVNRIGLRELQRLDAGGWFSREFAGAQVPCLDEVLALAKGRILLNIELKPAGGDQRELVEAVVAMVLRAQMGTETIFSSFDPDALRLARSLAPQIARAALFNPAVHAGLEVAAILDEAGSSALNLSAAEVSCETVGACHALGRPVAVYTVNEVSELAALESQGVDAVFTDRPDAMLKMQGAHEGGSP